MNKKNIIPAMPNESKRIAKKVDKKINEAQEQDFIYTDDNGKKKINYNNFSDYFINNYNLLRVDNKAKSVFMLYNPTGGFWREVGRDAIEALINTELAEYWTPSWQKGAFIKVKSSIPSVDYNKFNQSSRPLVFNFKNGVFNWNSMKLEPHNPKYYFTDVGGIELDTSNKPYPNIDKWLEETFKEDKQTIMEFIGYCFYPSYQPIQCFIILKANGGDGKSTFINFLTEIIGHNNTSNIPLQDFTKQNASIFKTSNLQGKYLNAQADISSAYIKDTSILKTITGDDFINADVKGKSDITFKNFAKILYACNELPPFDGNNNAMRRRSNILQFHTIKNFNKKYDWNKILEERPAFIWECIKLAKKAMERQQLTKSKKNLKAVDEWLKLGNPISEFIEDNTSVTNSNEEQDTEVIYNVYCNWCEQHGYNYAGIQKFRKEVTNIPNVKKVVHQPHGGKRNYYFTGIKLVDNIPEQMKIHPKDKKIYKK